MQTITSKNTALTQIAATFKKFNFNNSYVLDWGCGKGLSKKFCEKTFNNCKVELFDPFNGYESGVQEFCLFALSGMCECKFDRKIITCNNVLNVLEDHTLEEVLTGVFCAANLCKVNRIIFKIYEGNKSGAGKITKTDCYQRNEKTGQYLDKISGMIAKFGGNWTIRKTGQYIICDITH